MARSSNRRRARDDEVLRSYQAAAPDAELDEDVSQGMETSGWSALFDEADFGTRPRIRVSSVAAAGTVVSVIALCAVLTGVLVGEGLVVGVIGFGLSLAGLVAANRPRRVGSGLASLGVACGLTAIVIAVAALSGALPWLSANVDEVGRVHEWLREHWTWLPHR